MSSFLEAVRFLTIFPVWGKPQPERLKRASAWFPAVGLLLGFILYLANWLLGLSLPEQVVSVGLVLLLVVMTGGIHLDGLADAADGLFGGRDREQALEIMKDSRIGAFGVMAIVFVLLTKVLLLSLLAGDVRVATVLTLPVLGRFSVCFAGALFGAAKSEGLGSDLNGVGLFEVLMAALTTVAVAVVAFRTGALAVLLGVVLFVLVASFLMARRLGGMTGDTYGALIELTELWTLLLVVAFLL